MRTPLVCAFALLLAACTSHEGDQPESRPEPTPPVVPVAPQIALRGAIASVALVQDCPDPAASADDSPAQPSIAAGARARPGDGGGSWSQPCTQSSMQMTLSHDGREAQRFTIKAARLTAAGTGAPLAPIPVRGPTRWDDAGTYVPWNESLPAKTELKASYKLGEPDWSAVTKALGSDDTYAPRYVLEVDVEIAGAKITLRSPEFQREYPHVVVT